MTHIRGKRLNDDQSDDQEQSGKSKPVSRRSLFARAGAVGALLTYSGAGIGTPTRAGAATSNAGATPNIPTGATKQVPRPQTEEVPLDGNGAFYRMTVPKTAIERQLVHVPAVGTLTGDLSIFGRLSLPRTGPRNTLIIALHGITYDNSYWDVGLRPDTYNFSRYMTEAGYSVLAVDRLGYGSSSRPVSELVTLDAQAAVLHEIVQQVRAGELGIPFERILLVGHSYGSATAWLESSLYNDADAIISTGWANTIQTVPLARFFTGFIPTQVDRKFATAGHLPGYVTPAPGQRRQDFLYDLANVEPAMLEYDYETLRDTVTEAEAASFYNRYGAVPITDFPTTSESLEIPLSGHVKNIKIPTFLLNGQNELFFSGVDKKHTNSSQSLQAAEAKYFSREACFRAAVIPHASHDVNLQRNAQYTYSMIRTYADQVLGPDGENHDDYRSRYEHVSGANIPEGPAKYGAFGRPNM